MRERERDKFYVKVRNIVRIHFNKNNLYFLLKHNNEN